MEVTLRFNGPGTAQTQANMNAHNAVYYEVARSISETLKSAGQITVLDEKLSEEISSSAVSERYINFEWRDSAVVQLSYHLFDYRDIGPVGSGLRLPLVRLRGAVLKPGITNGNYNANNNVSQIDNGGQLAFLDLGATVTIRVTESTLELIYYSDAYTSQTGIYQGYNAQHSTTGQTTNIVNNVHKSGNLWEYGTSAYGIAIPRPSAFLADGGDILYREPIIATSGEDTGYTGYYTPFFRTSNVYDYPVGSIVSINGKDYRLLDSRHVALVG